MKNYSNSMVSIAVMFVVPALVYLGFSETCANEFVVIGVPFLVGLVLWTLRRCRGDVSWFGVRK